MTGTMMGSDGGDGTADEAQEDEEQEEGAFAKFQREGGGPGPAGAASTALANRATLEGLGDGVAAGAAEAAGTSGACVAGTSSSCSVAGRGAAACDVWVGAVSGVAMRADTATAVTTANGKARRTRVQKRMWGSPIL